MFARKIKPGINSNKYLTVILDKLGAPFADNHLPNAADILLKLMEFYQQESDKKTYFHLPASSRSHREDAQKCIELLKQNKTSNAMASTINCLNTITKINAQGDFALLLSTFFSVFPEYLPSCSERLHEAIVTQNLWADNVSDRVETYMQTHRAGSGSNDHELLEHISATMPNKMAEPFADFLLAQLHANRYEARKGLYKGWVCSALGKLLDQLPIVKRDIATKALQKEFAAAEYDLSIIGICEALSNANLNQKQLKEIANRLYSYTVDELPKLLDLFADHHNATITRYMEKIFSALKKFESHYTDIPRTSITTFLKKPENAYPLRNGILALESWIPNNSKLEFIAQLEINERFLALAPMFWHWLNIDENNKNVWAKSNRFNKRIEDTRNDLMGIFNNDSQITNEVKLLLVENTTNAETRDDIIINLLSELDEHNKASTADEVRKELHQSLALLKAWATANQLPVIAQTLQTSARPSRYETDAVRVSAAHAAAETCEHLSPEDVKILRDDLLLLLDGNKTKEAAAALQILAIKIPHRQLPELMTCLLRKNNGPAQLLLAELHGNYVAQEKQLEMTTKPTV